ncbi:unnamed protein product [Schistosoma bovis]|nr:unnamed protein product [Schistosoma bovis]
MYVSDPLCLSMMLHRHVEYSKSSWNLLIRSQARYPLRHRPLDPAAPLLTFHFFRIFINYPSFQHVFFVPNPS